MYLTKKGTTVYLIYLADKDETVPPAKLSVSAITGGKSVRMLGVDSPVTFAFDEKPGLSIEMPEGARGNLPSLGVCGERGTDGSR